MIKLQLENKRFGRLTVKHEVPESNRPYGARYWVCQCDCGNEKIVKTVYLTTGDTRSCGCWEYENQKLGSLKHGHAVGKVSREYGTWRAAKHRCLNPNDAKYIQYGGRGIKMCDHWANDFQAFINDMGLCPAGLTLERLNVNGDYEPSNCIWASWRKQARNKTNNIRVNYNGRDFILKDLAREIGCKYGSLWSAVKREEDLIIAATRLAKISVPAYTR